MDSGRPQWLRRVLSVATHMRRTGPAAVAAAAVPAAGCCDQQQLQRLFGQQARSEGPLAASGAGRRFHGIDLRSPLSPPQVEFLLDAVAQHRIVCVAGQEVGDVEVGGFGLGHFERLANHFGAPLPHPSNVMRGGVNAIGQGDSSGDVEWIPFEQRRAAGVNATFPTQLQCLEHNSPAVLVTSNFSNGQREVGKHDVEGPRRDRSASGVTQSGGGNWHTDIECEMELRRLAPLTLALLTQRYSRQMSRFQFTCRCSWSTKCQ